MNEDLKNTHPNHSEKKRNSLMPNLNQLAKFEQNKKVLLIVLAGIAVIFLSIFFTAHSPHPKKAQKTPNMTGIISTDFSQAENESFLTKEETAVDRMNDKVSQLTKELDSLTQKADLSETSDHRVIQQLQKEIAQLKKQNAIASLPAGQSTVQGNIQNLNEPNLPYSVGHNQNGALLPTAFNRGMTVTHFSYHESVLKKEKTAKTYVPAGTFVRAVVLLGDDTNAGVNGQTDTKPALLKLLSNGILPNKEYSSLKGCFVTAATYGDASSERSEIRLQELSCIRSSGQILDIPVEGTVGDMGGKNGVRGHIVMRNGQLVWNAGAAGMLSGIGSALQQSISVQSTSPLGTTTTIPSNQVWESGAYGGAGTAMSKLADYYIKLADLFHPVIELNAGSLVDVVFLKGFWLSPDQVIKTQKNVVSSTVNNLLPPDLMAKIKSAKLGASFNSMN